MERMVRSILAWSGAGRSLVFVSKVLPGSTVCWKASWLQESELPGFTVWSGSFLGGFFLSMFLILLA